LSAENLSGDSEQCNSGRLFRAISDDKLFDKVANRVFGYGGMESGGCWVGLEMVKG
jgi:hypothetical protein